MSNPKSWLKRMHVYGDAAGEFFAAKWRQLALRAGLKTPRTIMAYHGYANAERVWVNGRLLANLPYPGPQDGDGLRENISASYARWQTDEIPDAPVHLTYGTQQLTVRTDHEGYYHGEFARENDAAFAVSAEYSEASAAVREVHQIYVGRPSARFLFISDLDDTVVHTGVTNKLTAVGETLFRNANTRTLLPGAAALYRELAASTGGLSDASVMNPFFYVSNSPWNLYDLLNDFLRGRNFPDGPVLLRDVGLKTVYGQSQIVYHQAIDGALQ